MKPIIDFTCSFGKYHYLFDDEIHVIDWIFIDAETLLIDVLFGIFL